MCRLDSNCPGVCCGASTTVLGAGGPRSPLGHFAIHRCSSRRFSWGSSRCSSRRQTWRFGGRYVHEQCAALCSSFVVAFVDTVVFETVRSRRESLVKCHSVTLATLASYSVAFVIHTFKRSSTVTLVNFDVVLDVTDAASVSASETLV
jgi:hypothetical protein